MSDLIFDTESDKPFDSLEGRLLVASTVLDDSVFERTVVYICAHDVNGAVGVIVNRQIDKVPVKQMFPNDVYFQTKRFKSVPVMFGGPVSQDRFVIISATKEQEKNFSIFQSLTLYTEIDPILKSLIEDKNVKFLLAKGICAWDHEQLEHEMEQNCWLIANASIDVIFSPSDKHKWENILNSIGLKNFSNLVSYTGEA